MAALLCIKVHLIEGSPPCPQVLHGRLCLSVGEANAGMVSRGVVCVMLGCDMDPVQKFLVVNRAEDFTGFADYKNLNGKVSIPDLSKRSETAYLMRILGEKKVWTSRGHC